jgi:hypothetical protein
VAAPALTALADPTDPTDPAAEPAAVQLSSGQMSGQPASELSALQDAIRSEERKVPAGSVDSAALDEQAHQDSLASLQAAVAAANVATAPAPVVLIASAPQPSNPVTSNKGILAGGSSLGRSATPCL